jgi:hypothetical protein
MALWTNWSVCRGGTEEKTCRLLSTLIWKDEDDFFTKQSQEVFYFQSACENAVGKVLERRKVLV